MGDLLRPVWEEEMTKGLCSHCHSSNEEITLDSKDQTICGKCKE